MYSTHTETRTHLGTRFARTTRVLRADVPLSEDQMRAAAPSVFAEGKHASRSERYTYIPTIEVLRGLRKEGFEPFMVAQGASRIEGKAEFTKHMIRMRHAGQVQTRPEANEIILINSHDGASSFQMLAGMFRLCTAGHRRNYVQCRTMSRAAVDTPCAGGQATRDIEGKSYRLFRKAKSASSGRYRPGLPSGGVSLSRSFDFISRSASR